MFRMRTLRAAALCAGWLAVVCLAGSLAPSAASADEPTRAEQLRETMNQAKKLGAKGQLPVAWWDLDARLDRAEKEGASEAQWERMRNDAERLLNQARFVDRMRKQKSGIEAVLRRFDRALSEIAELQGVETDPLLSGGPAADDLLRRLGEANVRRRVETDSLRVANRRLTDYAESAAASDSLITALQVEVSALRKKLWETELRAGVAEADRSAAESVLTAKQQREEAIASLRATLSPDEAEILLTPEGGAVLRLFGISFAVGSAEIRPGQAALLQKAAEAIRIFPDAAVTVEGHTDNTGSRQSNLRLSRRRAETVARLLEQELGLDEGGIGTEGFGPDRPIGLNDTDEGRKRNRRIDVLISP